jgi:hypothetical protein
MSWLSRKTLESRRLTALRASTACYRDSVTFTLSGVATRVIYIYWCVKEAIMYGFLTFSVGCLVGFYDVPFVWLSAGIAAFDKLEVCLGQTKFRKVVLSIHCTMRHEEDVSTVLLPSIPVIYWLLRPFATPYIRICVLINRRTSDGINGFSFYSTETKNYLVFLVVTFISVQQEMREYGHFKLKFRSFIYLRSRTIIMDSRMRPVSKAHFTAIDEPIVQTLWGSQHLTTLLASTVCYRYDFGFLYVHVFIPHRKHIYGPPRPVTRIDLLFYM